MKPAEKVSSPQGRIVEMSHLSVPAARIEVLEYVEDKEETVNLAEADIVVSGGRGIKDPRNFELIARLAKACGPRITGLRQARGSPADGPAWFQAGDRILPASELDRVLPDTDHLVLCLPASPGTEGILDDRRLRLLPHLKSRSR